MNRIDLDDFDEVDETRTFNIYFMGVVQVTKSDLNLTTYEPNAGCSKVKVDTLTREEIEIGVNSGKYRVNLGSMALDNPEISSNIDYLEVLEIEDMG